MPKQLEEWTAEELRAEATRLLDELVRRAAAPAPAQKKKGVDVVHACENWVHGLGWDETFTEPNWVLMRNPTGGVGLSFQGERDYRPPVWPEQPDAQDKMIHLDIQVDDLDATTERAVAFGGSRGQIESADLPPEIAGAQANGVNASFALPDEGVDLDALVTNIERELIQRSLERTGGNKGQAARLLNLKRTTLVEKLKRL